MASDKTGTFKIIGELGSWEVSIVSGGTLRLAAHAFSLEGADYVFVALAEGQPHYEIELARIPKELVARIAGG
jgi:hypothetical protein